MVVAAAAAAAAASASASSSRGAATKGAWTAVASQRGARTTTATPQRRRYAHSQTVRSTGQGSLDPWNCLTFKASAGPPEPASNGALAQWPISIKDNFSTTDMPTTCASRMLAEYTPSFDATVVALLRRAGASLVGKTNLDEFAMGSANVHTHFGPVINPAAQDFGPGQEPRAAGGSSGGAAASVRAGLCRVAIGSDTGGSIRLPASHCGVWGLKPSYGLISRWGVVSYADSLDTVGIAAGSWDDIESTLKVLAIHDHKDPTSVQIATRHRAATVSERVLSRVPDRHRGSLRGLRVGVPQECFPAELNSQVIPAFEKVVNQLTSLGATVVPVHLPNIALALSAYYVITSAEASSNLARFDGVRYGFRHSDKTAGQGSSSSTSDADAAHAPAATAARRQHPYALTRSLGFGREVQKRLLLGAHALSADAFSNTFLRAQAIRKVIQQDFDDVFRIENVLKASAATQSSGGGGSGGSTATQGHADANANANADTEGVDVLVHPCSVNTAPTLHEAKHESSVEEYVQDLLTVPSSLAGLPAVSMPLGKGEDGWPVGTMAVSQWGMEDVLGVVARALQNVQ